MNISPLQRSAIEETLTTVVLAIRPEEETLLKQCLHEEQTSDDSLLGFGAELSLMLLAPVLFQLLKGLASTAANAFAKKWGEQLAKRLFDKPRSQDLRIDANSLADLRRTFVAELETYGFQSTDAMAIGNTLVATFVSKPELLRTLVQNSDT